MLCCTGGREHWWIRLGSGYFLWTDNSTNGERPLDAPFFAEEQCCVCGERRHVQGEPPANVDVTGAPRHEQE